MKLTAFLFSTTEQNYTKASIASKSALKAKVMLRSTLFEILLICSCQHLFVNKNICMKTRFYIKLETTDAVTLIEAILERSYKVL